MLDIVNDIANTDRAMGWIIYQIIYCAEDEKWYPALASLFMLTEQALRWVTNAEDEEKLCIVIERGIKDNLITKSEAETLHKMRRYRNKYMHSNFHGNSVIIDDLIYPVNDEETAEKIFNILSHPCFNIVLKLIT